MAVQFNLLPDVKLQFDQQQRAKRLVYAVSTLALGAAVFIFVVSFLWVNVLQKKQLDDASKNINTYSQKLKSIPDLSKVLTIQNQLSALPGLHASKHVSSRFLTYLPQITPSKVFIGQVTVDMQADTIVINGTTDSLETVNTFVDTLKFTNFTVGGDQSNAKPAFNNVILTNAGRSGKSASYSINANFDPALFDGSQNVSLAIPKQITTRSVIDSPDVNSLIFNGQTGKPATQQGAQ